MGFVPRKRRVTTTADTVHRIPDLLAGDFGASAPDEAPVGDIRYIRTRQGFLYVAFVLDLASRRVVGVSVASHMKASLVADTLREAIATRGGQMRGVVFHTDLGNTPRGPPPSCAGLMASHSRWAGPGYVGTTQPPSLFSAPSRPNSSTEPTTRAATRPAYRSDGGSKPGTTPAGFTPRSDISHQTNGRTTTTITRPHKPSVQPMGGTPLRQTRYGSTDTEAQPESPPICETLPRTQIKIPSQGYEPRLAENRWSNLGADILLVHTGTILSVRPAVTRSGL